MSILNPNQGVGCLKAIICSILLSASFHLYSAPSELIREIPHLGLADIAVASHDAGGPVIYFNPLLQLKVGPWVSEFFRAHEFFHHHLDHLSLQQLHDEPTSYFSLMRSFERAADCEAAKVVSPYAVLAAVEFFIATQGPTRPDLLHPTGYERAATIRECGGDR